MFAALLNWTVRTIRAMRGDDRPRGTGKGFGESCSQYADLYEFAPVAYLTLSPQGIIRRINRKGAALLGLPAGRLVGEDFAGRVAPEDAARWAEFLARTLAGAERQAAELALLAADGSPVCVNAESVRQAGGGTPAILLALTDITQWKRAERDLRASIEHYEAVARASNDAIVTTDSRGVIVAWNPSAEKIFGHAAAEAVGRPLEILVPHRYRRRHAGYMRRVLAGGAPFVIGRAIELTTLHKDGREFDVELSLTRWEVRDGTFFTAFIRDVTQRKRTEQRLRVLSEAVAQSPEAIVITDTNARIEYVNEAFVAHTGYRAEEVIGHNPRLLNSGKTPPQTYVRMWQALTRGEAWKGEFFNRKKDGSLFIEFAIIAPIRHPDGSITHYVAVKEDITEKKRLGKELDRYRYRLEEEVEQRTAQLAEARVQAEAANVAKSSFLANISHEIRTPMNAIVGLTHLMRCSDPTPRQLERLDKIDVAAHHLMALINNILDLTKIESGKMELEETDFDLTTIVENVRSILLGQAREKHLPIVAHLDDVPHWLHGDPTRLCQALLNYVSNAVKFTERGQIDIRGRVLARDARGLLLRFEVRDTGIGIPAEKLAGLFTAFEQVDTSITRKYGGTGLGLAITQRLARLMGGEAGVDSEFGRGSTFWFSARVKPGRGIMPSSVETPTDNLGNELRRSFAGARILLVDDVDVNLEVTQLLLHDVGLRVDSARNGQEAFDQACATLYDLILMDVQMPVMNGFQATGAIRGLPGRQDTPILAMTASAYEENRRGCLEAGMNDFIAKPIDPERLYAALLKWLPRKARGESSGGAGEPAASAPPAGAGLLRRLAAIPGFAGESGLARVRGNAAKFRQVLALFLTRHGGDLEALRQCVDAGDTARAEQLAHSLKGSAGLIGATDVARLAAALIDAVRTGAGAARIDRQFAALAPALRALIEGLEQAVAGEDAEAGRPAPAAGEHRLKQVLAQLDDLLRHGFIDASEFAEQEKPVLQAVLGERSAPLLAAIRTFDYPRALDELEKIRVERQA
ncbi:PAS domain S-box protein [Propionivibrio sp.]|uniref:PAS domain S-box protein n=1 Tax=Propionivibrio sp. TaxID=2212460 RepID=UPI0039E3DD6D